MTIAPPVAAEASARPLAASTVLGTIAQGVLRHRKIVLLAWLVIFLAGGMASSRVSSRLSVDFSLPGQPGYETGLQILHTFGNGGVNTPPSILVVTVPNGQGVQGDGSSIAAAFDHLRSSPSDIRVVDFATTKDKAFITNDGRSTFAYLFEPLPKSFGVDTVSSGAEDELQRLLPGDKVGLTGLNQLAAGGNTKGPGVLAETMLGVSVPSRYSPSSSPPCLRCCRSWSPRWRSSRPFSSSSRSPTSPTSRSSSSSSSRSSVSGSRSTTRCCSSRAGVKSEHAASTTHAAVVRAVETAGRAVLLSGLTVAIGLARPRRAAGTGAAKHRHRRDAHPADLDPRRAHPPSGAPRRHRTARRLAPYPPRAPREPRLERVGATGDPSALPGAWRSPSLSLWSRSSRSSG